MDGYLLENEHSLKEFKAGNVTVTLTNLRVIKQWKHGGETDFKDMHYRFIATIQHTQKVNWTLIIIGAVLLLAGFVPLIFFGNHISGAFFWVLGIVMLIQAYFFEKNYVELRGGGSSISLPNEPEIAKLVRKYQEKYLRGR